MDHVLEQIKSIAIKYKVDKILLFGSRARGDNTSVSDYDIAVFANGLSDLDKARFCSDVEELDTLKKIDVVFVDKNISDTLLENLKKDGVVIYEQVANQTK